MFDTLNELYSKLEKSYNELDYYISDAIDGSINEVSIFFKDYFNSSSDGMSENNDNPFLLQLDKITKSLNSLKIDSNEKWDVELIFVATTIGHLNEVITKTLCDYNQVDLKSKNTQANKINSLKDYLSKTVINDLHFINSFRNSILHHNDYHYDLLNLDTVTKNKLFNEAKTAVSKMHFIYKETTSILALSKKNNL